MLEYPHPIFATFIFPLFFLSLLFEILSYVHNVRQWRASVAVTLICAALLSFVSYYTGFDDFENLENLTEIGKSLVENHQELAKFYLISLLPTVLFSILRLFSTSNALNLLFVPFFTLSLLLSMFTSHKGGKLVFDHGIGVSQVKPTVSTNTQ